MEEKEFASFKMEMFIEMAIKQEVIYNSQETKNFVCMYFCKVL